MNVLFVIPPGNLVRDVAYGCWHKRKISYSWPPLNLAYYASSISQDHRVTILDCQVLNLNSEEAVNEIKKFSPNFLMIETGTLSFKDDIEFLKEVKKEIDTQTIVSGTHVTAKPKESLEEKEIDYIIRGEPEIVLDKLINGDKTNQGICTKDKITSPIYVNDLNLLEFPNRKLFNGKYKNPFAISEPFTTVITTRGCQFNCIFCTSPVFYGNKFRKRSVGNVIAELNTLRVKYKEIFFRDENMTFDGKFIKELCEKMTKKRMVFDWMCNSRIDTVNLSILKKMKNAGCHLIKFGVESGSERILKNLGKNITLTKIKKTFSICHELGIETLAHFMIGNPEESKRDIEKTINFAKELNPNFVSFDILVPLPGTILYENLEKEGKISYGKILDYQQHQTKINEEFCDVSSGELLSLYHEALRRFYFRPSVIMRNIRQVKSWKRFFDFSKGTVELWKDIIR